MELKNFVAETLEQLIDGVALSQEYAKGKNAVVNPETRLMYGDSKEYATDGYTGLRAQVIDFDIAIFLFSSKSFMVVVGGCVFGITKTVVTPPAAAAEEPVIQSSLELAPGSLKCTCTSIRPGRT